MKNYYYEKFLKLFCIRLDDERREDEFDEAILDDVLL